ncbi:c-type cytochrome [Roseovarius aestuariivivens]|uniref:c-type cytochrome n=1 Tax=Roseovarius aestuariivivens TaxID=1888910 RepID=UPI001080D761|nr:c-type cytochrome [Roseovarius aestuariivivens]
MKQTFTLSAALLALAVPALAGEHASGDAEAGEKAFNQCKACHMIQDADGEMIVRGGQVGPNLYGIVGRTAGSVEDFRYSDLLAAAGEQEIVWDEEKFVGYVQDPTGWLQEATGESGRSKMTYKLRKEEDGFDIWAYLASVGPDPES